MTMFRNLTVVAGILTFAATPSVAQDAAPAQPAQQSSGMTDTMREEMRGMMRNMMQDMMMRERPDGGRDTGRHWDQGRGEGHIGQRDTRQGRYWGSGAGQGRRGAMHTARMKVMFAVIDADGDGALSLEEVRDVQERIFDAVDADGDGRVTMEEIGFFFHGDHEEADR